MTEKTLEQMDDRELVEAFRNTVGNGLVCGRCVIDYWQNASYQMAFVQFAKQLTDDPDKNQEFRAANQKVHYRNTMGYIKALMALAHLRGWQIRINDYVSTPATITMYGDPVCDVHANECRQRELGPMTVRMGQWRR